MPISVGYQAQPRGVVDLASLQMRQQELRMQQQQQQQANWQSIANIFKEMQQKKKAEEQMAELKEEGYEFEYKIDPATGGMTIGAAKPEEKDIEQLYNAWTFSLMMGDKASAQRYSEMYKDALQGKYGTDLSRYTDAELEAFARGGI